MAEVFFMKLVLCKWVYTNIINIYIKQSFKILLVKRTFQKYCVDVILWKRSFIFVGVQGNCKCDVTRWPRETPMNWALILHYKSLKRISRDTLSY